MIEFFTKVLLFYISILDKIKTSVKNTKLKTKNIKI